LKNINKDFYSQLGEVKEWAAKNRVVARWDKVLNQAVDWDSSKLEKRIMYVFTFYKASFQQQITKSLTNRM
jgi:hypothetical protein